MAYVSSTSNNWKWKTRVEKANEWVIKRKDYGYRAIFQLLIEGKLLSDDDQNDC